MTTNDVALHQMAEKWLPLPPEQFFTAQRAPDMWFSDELPPTYQDELRSPIVLQSKAMLAFQILRQLAVNERRRAQLRQVAEIRSRIGKRVNTKRH